MMPEEKKEVQEVRCIKRPVFKSQHFLQFFFGMTNDELVRRIIHQFQQLRSFIDDGGAITPCKNGRKESRNFNILLPGKPVRKADWIMPDERGMVVFFYFFIKEIFQLFIHPAKLLNEPSESVGHVIFDRSLCILQVRRFSLETFQTTYY